jgi:hypothetical protein
MSDLLNLRDYHGDEFADRLAGLFRECQHRSTRAADLARQTEQRIEGMRRHTFDGLAEIGEALLRVIESLAPGEFEDWFSTRASRLGFCLRTAHRCKSVARLVREHGPDQAFVIASNKASDKAEPILALSFRLTKPVADLTPEECHQWRERLRPVVELDQQLATRLPRNPLQISPTG